MGVIRTALIAVISLVLRAAIHRAWPRSVGWGHGQNVINIIGTQYQFPDPQRRLKKNGKLVLCPPTELPAEQEVMGDPKMGRGVPPRKPQLGGGPVALVTGEPVNRFPGLGSRGGLRARRPGARPSHPGSLTSPRYLSSSEVHASFEGDPNSRTDIVEAPERANWPWGAGYIYYRFRGRFRCGRSRSRPRRPAPASSPGTWTRGGRRRRSCPGRARRSPPSRRA